MNPVLDTFGLVAPTTKPPLNSNRPPLSSTGGDDFQTDPRALIPLYPYLPKEWRIWEPACGKGNLAGAFREHGYECIGTDILTGHNALTWTPDDWDCAITNPPYSKPLKDLFIERFFLLGKPFALLLPVTAIAGMGRVGMYMTYGVEIIVPRQRVKHDTPGGQSHKDSSPWQAAVWITHGLEIGSALTFWDSSNRLEALSC